MRKIYRCLFVCVLVFLLAGITACGKSKSTSIQYTGSVTEVPLDRTSVDAVAGYDHRFAIFSRNTGEMSAELYLFDMEEGLTATGYAEEGYRYYAAAMNETEIYAFAQQIYENEYHLLKLDTDGNLIYDMNITDTLGGLFEIRANCDRMCCSDKYVCLLFDNFGVVTFNAEGQYLYKTDNEEINEIAMSGSETCLFVAQAKKERYIGQLKLGETKASEEQISQKTETDEYGYLAANTKGDIYFGNLNKVYRLEGKKLEDAASLNAFGGLNGSVRAFTLNDKMEVCIFAVREQEGKNAECAVMELFEGDGTEPVKEKLTFGVYSMDSRTQEVIQAFNALQTDFYIEGIEYDEESLARAILSGDAPDVVFLNASSYNYESYFEKGVFLDLTPYLEASELDISDYYENIMCGIRYENQIKALVPGFELWTTVGDEELFREQSMDVKSLSTLLGTVGENTLVIGASDAVSMLDFLVWDGRNNLVDFRNGKLKFTKEDIVDILEFCEAYSDLYSSDTCHYLAIAEQEVLLKGLYLAPGLDVSEIQACKTVYGSDYMYVGYPSLEGTGGTVFFPCNSLAIPADCKNPEFAWRFIEYWFSDEMQEMLAYNANWRSYVVNRDILEESLKESFVTDATDWIMLSSEQTAEAAQPDDEDLQKLLEVIEGVSEVYFYDADLNTIIAEEAVAFFNGGQSAEETAELIIERMQLYLDER